MERVSTSDSSDENSTESDEEVSILNSKAGKDRCIVNHDEVNSSAGIEEKMQSPLVRRLVPNRYRRKEEQAIQDQTDHSNDVTKVNRIRYGPPSVKTPYLAWSELRHWKLLLVFGLYLLPRLFSILASCSMSVLAALIVLWNRYASTLMWTAMLVSFWCMFLGPSWGTYDAEYFTKITTEHSSFRNVPSSSDLIDLDSTPPSEYNEEAFLFF